MLSTGYISPTQWLWRTGGKPNYPSPDFEGIDSDDDNIPSFWYRDASKVPSECAPNELYHTPIGLIRFEENRYLYDVGLPVGLGAINYEKIEFGSSGLADLFLISRKAANKLKKLLKIPVHDKLPARIMCALCAEAFRRWYFKHNENMGEKMLNQDFQHYVDQMRHLLTENEEIQFVLSRRLFNEQDNEVVMYARVLIAFGYIRFIGHERIIPIKKREVKAYQEKEKKDLMLLEKYERWHENLNFSILQYATNIFTILHQNSRKYEMHKTSFDRDFKEFGLKLPSSKVM